MTTKPRSAPLQASIAALLLAAAGCRRDDSITHFRAPKAMETSAARALPSAGPDIPAPPAPSGALRWTLPKGWTQKEAGGMRFATLKPPADRVDVSVIVLPGPAGGELANVNRWRAQLGLSAFDEAALASARKIVKTKAGPFAVYDFSSEGEKKSRLISALAVLDGNTWFLKMLGDAPAVASSRSDFFRLLEGLHVDPTN